MATPNGPRTTYVSGGQVLDAPPLSARLNRGVNDLYNAMGLYFVSLFSFDPYTAAQTSRFNTRGPGRSTSTAGPQGPASRLGGRSGGAGGSGGGSRSSGNGGRRLGTVDDVRGPECGSCG